MSGFVFVHNRGYGARANIVDKQTGGDIFQVWSIGQKWIVFILNGETRYKTPN